jgi:hypothetical protein
MGSYNNLRESIVLFVVVQRLWVRSEKERGNQRRESPERFRELILSLLECRSISFAGTGRVIFGGVTDWKARGMHAKSEFQL